MEQVSQDNTKGFGFLLHDVARLLWRRFEKKAVKLGLTRAQWSVLSFLVRKEGINQTTLAELMDIEPITLVGLLDRLERANWVERRPDPGDRRARLLYLTEEVQPILAEMRAIGAATRREAFAGIASGDQQRIMALLEQIKVNLSAPKDERAK